MAYAKYRGTIGNTGEAAVLISFEFSSKSANQLQDYQRGVLALRMKPIIEARAKAQQEAGNNQYSLRPKSDEASPIRTDVAVADLANLGKDTIRKIEHIEEVAAPEVKALAASANGMIRSS